MEKKTVLTTEPVSCVIKNYRVPRLQRMLDKDHVKSMIDDQIVEYNKHNCFSMLQSITIAFNTKEMVGYILDGQHRIKAFQELGTLGYPIHEVVIPVVRYNVQSQDEVWDYFTKINKHMPIHPFEKESAWEDAGKVFCQMMQQNFDAYMKNKEAGQRCNCPHLSYYDLKTNLSARNIPEKLDKFGKSIIDLWACVLDVNSFLKDCAKKQLNGQMAKRLKDCEEKGKKMKCSVCYLGAWRHFEWLDIALYLLEKDIKMNDADIGLSDFTDSKVKPKIPIALRTQVWKKHTCNIVDEGHCYVCDKRLYFSDMECGHIIAHALGGDTSLENLMPVCKSCNLDMGIMNLEEYKKMVKGL